MEITLRKLKLTNFKGIRSLEIELDKVTDIFGDNGTGKTTVFDAFHWLLFGKDSQDRSDFNIKTLGPDNQPYHHLDHEVSADLLIDGNPVKLRRCLTENWVKKRGQEHQEFSGHTTSYFWNDVPMSKADYEAKINYHIDSSIFKLVTNTSYFNSLNWQDRRGILIKISGEISNEDVLDRITRLTNKGQFDALVSALNQGKTVDEFKREVSSKRKLLKDQLTLIPSRIDEANRSLPEQLDYKSIEVSISVLESEIEKLDNQLGDRNKAIAAQQQRYKSLLDERSGLMDKASDIEYQVRETVKSQVNHLKSAIAELKRTKASLLSEITEIDNKKARQVRARVDAFTDIKAKTEKADALREQWKLKNSEEITFDESKFSCPTCKRAYDEHDIESTKEKMIQNFQEEKSRILNEISTRGKSIKNEIQHLQSLINNIDSDQEERELKIIAVKSQIADNDSKLVELQADLDRKELDIEPAITILLNKHQEYQLILSNIRELKEKIESPQEGIDNSNIINEKKGLQLELDELRKQLASKTLRDRIEARIIELQSSEKEMAQELASLEAIEFSIEEFTVAKMNALEESLNNRFEFVKFKLFKEQINGGRTETCDTLINGVPYSDANNASRINAGIDIINTLSEYYKITAPVFVDNAESVNKLIDSNSQVIRLVVSKDKSLKIQSVKAENSMDSALQSSAK